MNNQQKLIAIYASLIIVVLVVIGLIFIARKAINTPGTITTQPPTPTLTIEKGAILQSSPSNGEANTSTNQPVTLSFSPSVDLASVAITSNPVASFTQSVSGNNIVLTPNQPLEPGTSYKIVASSVVNGQTQYSSITFTTEGPTQTPIPLNNSGQVQQQVNQYDKTSQPDIYLYNHSPYTGTTFSITATLDSNGNIQFTVQSIGSNSTQSKNDFISWAESLGLTAAQIDNLDITYQ